MHTVATNGIALRSLYQYSTFSRLFKIEQFTFGPYSKVDVETRAYYEPSDQTRASHRR
jgi:hypothetical protein